MNEKQQTAVQWLVNQLLAANLFEPHDTDRGFEQRFKLGLLEEQALEMQREQIEQAYNDGGDWSMDGIKYFTDTYQTEP